MTQTKGSEAVTTTTTSDAHLPPHTAMPAVPSSSTSHPLSIRQVKIHGGFWGKRQQLMRDALIPHALEWMERLGWVDNLRDAAAGKPFDHAGYQFADSEVYKIVEAMCWDLVRAPDEGMLARVDELVGVIVAAQEPDGYLHTLFGRPWQKPRYSDMAWGHELYCFGHLIHAAVAHHRATASTELLDVARRTADHVCIMFGSQGMNRVCGHPGIETALVELYRTTGEERYLDQAMIFIDRRGSGTLPVTELGAGYWQDAISVRRTTVMHGHAVRALYLAAGAVDAAVEKNDTGLLAIMRSQWDATTARRTYITGGMGSHHMDEAFGEDYVLPPDRSYCETCAGVASIMLSWRLLLATGEARYADLMERTLYNVVATALSSDGTKFFYANTLHQRSADQLPATSALGVAIRGGAAQRQPWFEVSCCPPNVARLLASLGAYAATAVEDGVMIHQYVAGSIHADTGAGPVALSVETRYPEHGSVTIRVETAPAAGTTLRIRVPSWADGATLTLPGGTVVSTVAGEYVAAVGVRKGQSISLTIPLTVRATYPDPRIDAVRGTVAFEKGPEVLALESHDLPAGWLLEEGHLASVAVTERNNSVYVALQRVTLSPAAWPYSGSQPVEPVSTEDVALVPYHQWAERGPAAMRIFLPLSQSAAGTGYSRVQEAAEVEA